MKHPIFYVTLIALFSVQVSLGRTIKQEPSKKIETLDDQGKVVLSWVVDEAEGLITFEIEAETSGYVGFGISPQGSMPGADIFIAGVYPNSTVYFSDRHATALAQPIEDDHADWSLITATEMTDAASNKTTTYLKFSRLLNTCDDQDYPINDDTSRLIWALGDTDTLAYHTSERRGSRSINLLAAPMPAVDLSQMKRWNATLKMPMPSDDTAYWCSLHKGPNLTSKHHVVAFDALLTDENALKHTHHFIIYNCYLPDNQTVYDRFENLTVDKGFTGDHCYKPSNPIPIEYCPEYLYVWAKGGKRMVFPETVGYAIGGENPEKQTYYMLEIHYDNPDKLVNVTFESGVELFYTDELRGIEAGQLVIGHDVNPVMTVPPNMTDFVISGHCASECTANFTDGGITVFNVLLHSHLSGRKLKVRHFRDDVELPWLDFDDHYDFDYQQNKHLSKEIKVLPGDQLTYECTYNSAWKNGSVVVGALTTRDEMCEAFLWYYPKVDIDNCLSSYPGVEGLYGDFGITEIEAVGNEFGQNFYYIKAPPELVGDYEDSISHKFPWTDEFIKGYQQRRRYGMHEAYCMSRKNPDSFWLGAAQYPFDFVKYVPENVCSKMGDDEVTTTTEGRGPGGSGISIMSSVLTVIALNFMHFVIA